MFMLSARSESNLAGVDPGLVKCVRRAIATSSVDFTVFEGMRTRERQAELYKNGVSRTMDSRHITGHAVDLVPYIGGRVQWQMPGCIQIAIAMREASAHFGVPVTWGCVWDRELFNLDPRQLDDETEAYVSRYRIKNGARRHPLIDGPHYQVDR